MAVRLVSTDWACRVVIRSESHTARVLARVRTIHQLRVTLPLLSASSPRIPTLREESPREEFPYPLSAYLASACDVRPTRRL